MPAGIIQGALILQIRRSLESLALFSFPRSPNGTSRHNLGVPLVLNVIILLSTLGHYSYIVASSRSTSRSSSPPTSTASRSDSSTSGRSR